MFIVREGERGVVRTCNRLLGNRLLLLHGTKWWNN